MSASARDAHMESCSPAAARKVSPAASRTFVPAHDIRLATLPTVVVLPTPLTPTNSQTSTGPPVARHRSPDGRCPLRVVPLRRPRAGPAQRLRTTASPPGQT